LFLVEFRCNADAARLKGFEDAGTNHQFSEKI